ncbi:aromatic motif membrane protein [Mycoplasma corogypsi]|uniref:aromatic motif membrane protein n=1 Tax=Mycoplasma corogypsi TaxID=2106 RepID=UPI003872BEEA
MKKWLTKISLVFASSIALVSLVSCQNKSTETKTTKKPAEKTKNVMLEKLDPIIQNYTNNDQFLLNSLLKQQLDDTYTKFDELKSALTWAPLFYTNIRSNNSSLRTLTSNGVNIVNTTLKQNWLWLLNYLNRFVFVFNPYGEEYNDDFEEDVFNKVKTKIGSLFLKLDTNKLTEIYSVLVEPKWYQNDPITNLQAHYLIFPTGFMKLYSYEFDNKKQIFLVPDFFMFDTDENTEITWLKDKLNALETKIWEQRQKNIEQLLKEDKDAFEPKGEEVIKQNNQLNQYFKPYDQNSYVLYQFNALKELSELPIIKFTLRSVEND